MFPAWSYVPYALGPPAVPTVVTLPTLFLKLAKLVFLILSISTVIFLPLRVNDPLTAKEFVIVPLLAKIGPEKIPEIDYIFDIPVIVVLRLIVGAEVNPDLLDILILFPSSSPVA